MTARFLVFPRTSSSLKDMQLICHSSSTTTVLAQPSPAARAWWCVKAASVWAQTATSWGRETTCCAPSRLNQPRLHQPAASPTGQNARRANQTASGWSSRTATARQQHSAAWASPPAAGAAAAAPSWSPVFSVPNDVTGRTYKRRAEGKKNNTKTNKKKQKTHNCYKYMQSVKQMAE